MLVKEYETQQIEEGVLCEKSFLTEKT